MYHQKKYLPKLAPFKIVYLISLVLFFLIILIFWKVIVHYVYIKDLRQQKCGCANDWRQKLLQYGPIINITIGFILFYCQFLIIKKNIYWRSYNIIPLTFYVVYITYIHKLIKNKCHCSNNWKRDFIFILTIVLVVIQSIGLFLSWT